MRAAAVFGLVAAGLAAVAAPRAQDTSFWSFIPEDSVIDRCTAGTPAHGAAAAGLGRLSARIDSLRDSDPHAPVLDELHALLHEPCFVPASETDRLPRPDSAASLREWGSAGGLDWLRSYLELPNYNLVSHVVLPPDARPTLLRRAAWNGALAEVICDPGDRACGGQTRGWRDRAEAAFELHHQAGKHRSWSERQQPRDPESVSRSCAAVLETVEPQGRYLAWRECLESSRPRRRAMPLGATRAPGRGWFIIEGRRGHQDFCDGIAAYDLTTGAALAVRSCSALVLETDGSMNIAAIDARRKESVTAGAMPVDNLREAVWMLALRTQVPELQVAAEFYPLPKGLEVVSSRAQPGPERLQSSVFSTGQTLLAWHWLLDGRVPVSGGLLLGSFEAHEAHAEQLLLIAEAGLVEGCVRARPPASVTFGSKETEDRYQDALKKWRRAPRCR